MPTKPTDQPEHWATDAVYTTGPFIGQPQKVIPPPAFAAEGHRPGANFPTPAEYENSQQNLITGLCRWVFLGTSAPDPDAHIVETDSTGRAGLHGLTVNNTDAAETGLSVFSAATSPQFGALITCTAGGTGLGVSIGNASATAIQTATGTGTNAAGLGVIMSSTPIGGSGVRVISDSTTAAPALRVEHDGAGIGVQVTHTGSGEGLLVNAASGSNFACSIFGNATAPAASVTGGTGQGALLGTSGANAIAAIGGQGTGTAIGVTGDGGSGSAQAAGVRGTSTHEDAPGVWGRTSMSASALAAGVLGQARGLGTIGVMGNGGTVGRGVVAQADTTSPAYSAMRIIPQDADPTSATQDGELIWHALHKQLRTCVAGYGYRSIPTFGPGSAFRVVVAQAHNDSVNYGASYTPVVTVQCLDSEGTGYHGSAAGAEVAITFSADVRPDVAADSYVNVRVVDVSNGGVTIAEWSGAGTVDNAGFYIYAENFWQRAVTFGIRYAPPSDGDLVIRVEFSRPPADSNQYVRNAVLTVEGTF